MSNYTYGSAKAGFTAYLSGLRNRLYHANVHVVSIQPGFVHTRMTEGLPLPKLLTAEPELVGESVYNAIVKKEKYRVHKVVLEMDHACYQECP